MASPAAIPFAASPLEPLRYSTKVEIVRSERERHEVLLGPHDAPIRVHVLAEVHGNLLGKGGEGEVYRATVVFDQATRMERTLKCALKFDELKRSSSGAAAGPATGGAAGGAAGGSDAASGARSPAAATPLNPLRRAVPAAQRLQGQTSASLGYIGGGDAGVPLWAMQVEAMVATLSLHGLSTWAVVPTVLAADASAGTMEVTTTDASGSVVSKECPSLYGLVTVQPLASGSLQRLLNRTDGAPCRSLAGATWLMDVCAKLLSKMHMLGVAHADVKYDNMLYFAGPTPSDFCIVLCDLGHSYISPDIPSSLATFAAEGVLLDTNPVGGGTPQYRPPEQVGRGATGGLVFPAMLDVSSLGTALHIIMQRRLRMPRVVRGEREEPIQDGEPMDSSTFAKPDWSLPLAEGMDRLASLAENMTDPNPRKRSSLDGVVAKAAAILASLGGQAVIDGQMRCFLWQAHYVQNPRDVPLQAAWSRGATWPLTRCDSWRLPAVLPIDVPTGTHASSPDVEPACSPDEAVVPDTRGAALGHSTPSSPVAKYHATAMVLKCLEAVCTAHLAAAPPVPLQWASAQELLRHDDAVMMPGRPEHVHRVVHMLIEKAYSLLVPAIPVEPVLGSLRSVMASPTSAWLDVQLWQRDGFGAVVGTSATNATVQLLLAQVTPTLTVVRVIPEHDAVSPRLASWVRHLLDLGGASRRAIADPHTELHRYLRGDAHLASMLGTLFSRTAVDHAQTVADKIRRDGRL